MLHLQNTADVASTIKTDMSVWMIFEVLGGLAVFLYGMLTMEKSVRSVAGEKFRQLLLTFTNKPYKGVLTGLAVTSIIQSSSTTTVMEVGLVGAGLMTFFQSMGITLGAEVGTTITAQIVAFRITKYALLIIAIGLLGYLIVHTKKAKEVCNSIIGLGIVFFGLDIMSRALSPLRGYKPFLDLMTTIETPILGILFGLIFTCIIQSSSATSGITVAMGLAGAITLKQAIPINLGASIGTSITAFLASLPLSREAKRVAYFHTVSQLFGVIIVSIIICIPFGDENLWLHFVKYVTKIVTNSEDLPRQIAMAHTLMPIIKLPFIFPLLHLISKLLNKIFPSKEEEKPFGPIYISDTLLDTPELALIQAKKEVLRQGEIVYEMLEHAIECFNKNVRSLTLCETVSLSDIKVDTLRNSITDYLRKLVQRNLTEKQSKQEITLLYIIDDLETIGDIIDKNITPIAKKTVELDLMFSREGWYEICDLHNKVAKNFKNILYCFEKNDTKLAKEIALTKPEIGKYESELKMHHIQRLHKGLPESIETSAMHLDLIDHYKRINGHIVSIAYAIMGQL